MKRTIRFNVFETNSSSTHSLSIMSPKNYKKWKNGKLLFNEYTNEFKEDNEENEDEDFKTFGEFFDTDFEEIDDVMETPNGETIHLVGYYGFDG